MIKAPTKVLGLGYDAVEDKIFVRITEKRKDEVKTRRDILRLTASVFDPIGLACPYVLKGKMLSQIANELDLEWKDPLPQWLLDLINEWKNTMEGLNRIRIDRWTSKPGFEASTVSLLICCNASIECFGVTCHVRKESEDGGEAHVAFIYAKARVVPLSMSKEKLKNQEDHGDSIPRLEVHAARLGAEIKDMLERESGEKFKSIFMFTDSLTILQWIFDFDKKHKTFENFRLKKIRLLTNVTDWRHIPSALNPADICSHGLLADEKSQERWNLFISGPPFAPRPIEEWPDPNPAKTRASLPAPPAITADVAVIASMFITSVDVDKDDDKTNFILDVANRHQFWNTKVKKLANMKVIFATFLKFLKLRSSRRELKKLRLELTLTLSDFKAAELKLIKAIQFNHFNSEMKRLLKLGVISPNATTELRSNSSKITSLSPFLDEQLCLRAGGRLGKSDTLDYDFKHPLILPVDENVRSLIRQEHIKHGHATINQLFHILRSKYFIMGGRNTISSVIRYCVDCQRHDKSPQQQKTGDLPIERISLVRPFQSTGIDCFGPFVVKHGGRKTHKRWVLLLTCLATRAIALLPLRDMSTDTMINCLTKFHNYYPTLELLYSDNGTNFKGASREIKEAFDLWKNEKINDTLVLRGMEWKWSPPYSPHFGGVWERMVKSAKRHLTFLLGKDLIAIDVFDTALTSAAAILNSRPLTHASGDINDMQTLSPNNFLFPYLINPSSTSFVPPIPADGDHLRAAWRDVRRLITEFEARWKSEYLARNIRRKPGEKCLQTLYQGQLVIVKDDTESRHSWPVGKIEEIVSERPENAHRFLVKLANGKTIERHFNMLVPLELERTD